MSAAQGSPKQALDPLRGGENTNCRVRERA